MTTQAFFHEEQKFRQVWFVILILIVLFFCAAVVLAPSIIRLINNIQSDQEVPWFSGIAFPFIEMVVLLLVGYMVLCGTLITTVTEKGISYRFVPFHLRTHLVPFQDIRSYKATTYRPIRDYGGWGIRYGQGGKAYNVSGKEGVKIELTNGKTLLFGSQKARQMEEAIKQAISDRSRHQGK